jgi:hypothetical protein
MTFSDDLVVGCRSSLCAHTRSRTHLRLHCILHLHPTQICTDTCTIAEPPLPPEPCNTALGFGREATLPHSRTHSPVNLTVDPRSYTRQARERKRGGTPEEGEEGYGEDGVYADEGENGAKLRRTDYASSPPPFDPPQHRMLPQLVVQGQGSPAQIPELIQHPPAPSAPPSLHPALPPQPDRNGGRAQPT